MPLPPVWVAIAVWSQFAVSVAEAVQAELGTSLASLTYWSSE